MSRDMTFQKSNDTVRETRLLLTQYSLPLLTNSNHFCCRFTFNKVQLRLTKHRPFQIFRTALYYAIDTVNPFSATRKLKWTLNWLESDFKFLTPCAPWVVTEKAEVVCLTRKMSSFSDKGVEISVEKHTPFEPVDYRCSAEISLGLFRVYRKMMMPSADLVVEFKGQKEPLTMKIGLPGKMYKTDDIKVEVKDALLEVTIPKVNTKRVDDFKTLFASPKNQH